MSLRYDLMILYKQFYINLISYPYSISLYTNFLGLIRLKPVFFIQSIQSACSMGQSVGSFWDTYEKSFVDPIFKYTFPLVLSSEPLYSLRKIQKSCHLLLQFQFDPNAYYWVTISRGWQKIVGDESGVQISLNGTNNNLLSSQIERFCP